MQKTETIKREIQEYFKKIQKEFQDYDNLMKKNFLDDYIHDKIAKLTL